MIARAEVPTPGVNKLTERLMAQGVDPYDVKTWPAGVWRGDGINFLYSREWKYTPTFESPCGLLIHEFGQTWGSLQMNGEFKCCENDNPLFACPCRGKPCPHRLKAPAGINCQFHRTDREWDGSYEALEKANRERLRAQWQTEIETYPGWDGNCVNLRREDLEDGTARYQKDYNVNRCISMHCMNTQCVCRHGAKRDVRKANIFYDVYIERHYTIGMIEQTDKVVRKGLKALDKPAAWTYCEILLKMWEHDPYDALAYRLNPLHELERHEEYFVRIHGKYGDMENLTIKTEIRNVRVARNEQKDLLNDLQLIQDGIAVEHESDLQAAKAVKKKEDRKNRELDKLADRLAREKMSGMKGWVALWGVKDTDERNEIKARSEKIIRRQEKAREIQALKDAQVSFFDMGGDEG